MYLEIMCTPLEYTISVMYFFTLLIYLFHPWARPNELPDSLHRISLKSIHISWSYLVAQAIIFMFITLTLFWLFSTAELYRLWLNSHEFLSPVHFQVSQQISNFIIAVENSSSYITSVGF